MSLARSAQMLAACSMLVLLTGCGGVPEPGDEPEASRIATTQTPSQTRQAHIETPEESSSPEVETSEPMRHLSVGDTVFAVSKDAPGSRLAVRSLDASSLVVIHWNEGPGSELFRATVFDMHGRAQSERQFAAADDIKRNCGIFVGTVNGQPALVGGRVLQYPAQGVVKPTYDFVVEAFDKNLNTLGQVTAVTQVEGAALCPGNQQRDHHEVQLVDVTDSANVAVVQLHSREDSASSANYLVNLDVGESQKGKGGTPVVVRGEGLVTNCDSETFGGVYCSSTFGSDEHPEVARGGNSFQWWTCRDGGDCGNVRQGDGDVLTWEEQDVVKKNAMTGSLTWSFPIGTGRAINDSQGAVHGYTDGTSGVTVFRRPDYENRKSIVAVSDSGQLVWQLEDAELCFSANGQFVVVTNQQIATLDAVTGEQVGYTDRFDRCPFHAGNGIAYGPMGLGLSLDLVALAPPR